MGLIWIVAMQSPSRRTDPATSDVFFVLHLLTTMVCEKSQSRRTDPVNFDPRAKPVTPLRTTLRRNSAALIRSLPTTMMSGARSVLSGSRNPAALIRSLPTEMAFVRRPSISYSKSQSRRADPVTSDRCDGDPWC